MRTVAAIALGLLSGLLVYLEAFLLITVAMATPDSPPSLPAPAVALLVFLVAFTGVGVLDGTSSPNGL